MKQIYQISQPVLIGKFKVSLQLQHRFSEAHNLSPEFCYGFSWRYLRAKSKGENEVKKFFQELYIVAAWDGKNKKEQEIVDELYKEVDRIQNSERYNKKIRHAKVNELFNNEIQSEKRYYFIFNNPDEIQQFLKDKIPQEKQIICGSASHATAIYKRDGTISYYDSNNSKGERSTKEIEPLAKHIYRRLKTHNQNYWNGSLPFTYSVFKNSNQSDDQLMSYEEFIREQIKLDPDCLNRKDGKGVTALYLAAQWQDKEACSLLLSLGADPNVYNVREEMSLFERLMLKEDFDIALLLASNDKFDVSIKTKEGKTALQLAVENNCAEIVDVILKKSPNTGDIRKYSFQQLNSKAFISGQNPEIGFSLMQKYCGTELANGVCDFLSVKPSNIKTQWFSLFQKQPEENEQEFFKMLSQKIEDKGGEANSAENLNDIILEIMKDCSNKKLHFSDTFKERVNFVIKYLNHTIKLEKSLSETKENTNLNLSANS